MPSPARCDARALSLAVLPASPTTTALIAALVEAVEGREGTSGSRSYRRGEAAKAKLHNAVAAIVSGLLLTATDAADPGPWSCHPRRSAAFRGQPIPKRAFDAALAGLKGLGMVEGEGSFFRATPALVAKAAKGFL